MALGQKIDDLALPFVTPLSADDDNETTGGHVVARAQREPAFGLRMYLKKSLSGETTMMSPSLPSEFL